MAVVVGHGVVPIKPDFGSSFHSTIQREGAKATDGLTKQFGGAFKNIAKLAGGIFIGAQVVSVFKDAFAEAAEAQKIGKLTEQVIKTTGGAAKITAKQIGELSTAISNKAGIDDEAIQSGANLVATFTRVRNEAGKGNDIFSQTVQVATDMSVALGQDMKSSSLQLGKALNDPIKGVTALTRAGVSFTQGQKDQIKKMQESGDLLGAQKLILAEVQTQFGGAAAAAASPVDKLKVVWGNLLEDLGTRALPMVETVASWLGVFLPKALDFLGDAFRKVADPAKQLFEIFAHRDFVGGTFAEDSAVVDWAFRIRDAFLKVVEVGKKLAGFAKDALGWVFDFVKADPAPVFAALGTVILLQLVPATWAWAAGLIASAAAFIILNAGAVAIAAGIALLVGGIVYAYKHFEVFRNVVDTVARFVQDHLKPVLIGLGAVLLAPVVLIVGGLVLMYQKFSWFRAGVEIAIAVVKKVISTAVDAVVWVFSNVLLPAVHAVGRFFTEVLWPAVQTAWDGITKVVVWAWQNVLLPTFNFIWAFITNVLIPVFNFLKSVIVDFVFPLIVAAIKDAWGIIKPVFDIIVGFLNAVLMPVFNHLWGVVSDAFGAIREVITAAWDFIQPILQTVITFIAEKLGPVWEGMRAMAEVAFKALPGLIGAALRLVGGIVAGFLDGVGSIADAIGLKEIGKVLKSGAGSARKWGQEGVATSDTRAGGAGRALALGGRVPGSHNRDDVDIRATPGEWVITKPSVEMYERKYGKGFMRSFNAGHFAAGGLIPDIGDIVDKARGLGTSALERVWPMMDVGGGAFTKGGIPAGGANYMRDAIFKLIRGKESEGKYSGSGAVGGAGAEAAAGWIRTAMGLTSTPESWFNTLMARAKMESGFNPRAINLWDSNAKKGTPSKGLFQTIDGTFNRYKLPGHGDIWNPVDNAAAAMQYIKARYGTIFNINPRTGYELGGLVAHQRSFDQGGILAPGANLVWNGTGSNEPVVPRGAGLNIEHVHVNNPEDVDEFWRRGEFAAMKMAGMG